MTSAIPSVTMNGSSPIEFIVMWRPLLSRVIEFAENRVTSPSGYGSSKLMKVVEEENPGSGGQLELFVGSHAV